MAWMTPVSDADISSQTLIYTVPTGYEGRLEVEFTNRSASATATVQLWVVPNGESVGNEHLKEPSTLLDLAGALTAVLTRKISVPSACKVYVQASNTNVSCQVSGDVVSPDTFGVTDGTADIVYESTWAGTTVSLKKDQNGQVSLNMKATASGSPSNTICTLPSGYRPSVEIVSAGLALISGSYYPYGLTISTAGAIRQFVTGLSGAPSVASGSTVNLHVSFFV